MATARDLFGNTFGMGSHNLPPHKGLPRKLLVVGNIINLVNPSAQNATNKVKEFISDQRIDLVYEEMTRILTILFAYSAVKSEEAVVSEVLSFAQPPQMPNDNNWPQRVRRVKAVPCDTIFTYNGKCFMLRTQSDGRRAFAVCVTDGEQLCLSNDELWDLILDNL